MVEIRIVPNSPEMMAKVIALLADINGVVTMAHRPAPRFEEELAVPPTTQEPAAELPEVTLELVRARLAELSAHGKTSEVRELLANYNASKLTDVSPEHFAELLTAAEAL